MFAKETIGRERHVVESAQCRPGGINGVRRYSELSSEVT